MSRGKYLSLEEARNADKIDRFCKEHETKGDQKEFDRILNAMSMPVKKKRQGGRTSKKGQSACYTGIQIQPDTFAGAFWRRGYEFL